MHASYLIKRQQKSSDERGDGSRTEDCGGYAQGGRRQESGECPDDRLGDAVQVVPDVAEGVHKRLADPHGDDAQRRRVDQQNQVSATKRRTAMTPRTKGSATVVGAWSHRRSSSRFWGILCAAHARAANWWTKVRWKKTAALLTKV